QRVSHLLAQRDVGDGHETVTVICRGQSYRTTRTYTVHHKLTQEIAPNDWYLSVVLRGAYTCGLPEQYCWQLFHHMHHLQQTQKASVYPKTA
ncbi:MAG: gamma-glutamylcyclotransferase, partial [Cyanobacteria bacterium J06639_14]